MLGSAFDTAAGDLRGEAAAELGPFKKTVLPPLGADGAAEKAAAMFDKVVTRLVDLENEIVEVGGSMKDGGDRGRRRSKDLPGVGSPGFGLEDGETAEHIETKFAGVAPFDLVGARELAADGKVAGDSVSADVEDPANERGAPRSSLSAGFVRFNFMDEGGGGGGVRDKLVEDGIDLTPKVAIGALLKG